MHILLTLSSKWNLVLLDELTELVQFYSPKASIMSKNLIDPIFYRCFYLPKLMDVYLLEGIALKLTKFGSYSKKQLFSHGQLVIKSTHSFFAYFTHDGHHFKQLWMEDNHLEYPSFPCMWIIPHLLNYKVRFVIRACMIIH
jgi:hypothetical protein